MDGSYWPYSTLGLGQDTRLLVCDGLQILTLLTVPTGNSVCKLAFRSIP